MANHVTSQPNSRGDFEIGIVCAQSFEYDAVCILFDNFWDEEGDTFGRAEGDPNTYTTGCMGGFNIVVVLLCNTGKVSAASAASSLRSSYSKIKLLILTGVCAAVPKVKDEELLLGDVIISKTVIQYDLGGQYSDGFSAKNTLEYRLGRPDKNVRNLAAIIETEMGLQRLEDRTEFHLRRIQDHIVKKKDKRSRNIITYEYPGSTYDALYESTYFHKHRGSPQCICSDCHRVGDPVCDESKSLPCDQVGCEDDYLVPRLRLYEKRDLEISGKVTDAQKPRIFTGRFGSGDTVLNSGIDRDRLAQEHSIIAFEMEGAGVWDELPCILVKGVCSYGDGHKSNNWQHFAAATAASATKGLIERYTHTDISPSTPFIHESKMNKVTQDQACLRDLRNTDPRDDKTRIQRTKGGLLRGSYSWILDNYMFKSWCDDPEARLLWIKGDPGKGKTMLLCGIIDELEKRPSTKLCYSFCQATDLRINNATAVMRGLLYMLLHQQESLLPYIKEEYDVSGKTLFEDANSWTALSKIFYKILADPSLENSIIIIDALDECLVDLLPLLEWISQSLSSSIRVKWLISSRNRLDIQEALASANKSTLSLELNEESVSKAITVYIDHKVQLLSDTKNYGPAQRNYVKNYLSTNANGTFLWVALVCDLLERAYLGDIPEEAKYPQELDNLYERMIQTVCSEVTDHGKRILSIVTVARRPLALQELISLMPVLGTVEDEPLLLDQLCEKITGVCGSFLTTRDHIIYFIHQSAKDFLLGKGFSKLFPTGIEETERYMFEASITSMTRTLKRDIYNLVEPGFPIESLPVFNNDLLYPVAYSCIYWIEHFEHSVPKVTVEDETISRNHELLLLFLKEKYLYWLEALSLLKLMAMGWVGMQKLERLVETTQMLELKELVWDAYQFIRKFRNAIEAAPLQVYVSALLFCPTQSRIRQLFTKDSQSWATVISEVETLWDEGQYSLEGHDSSINSIALSSNGAWLASIAEDESGIIIWDVKTGEMLRRIYSSFPDCTSNHYRYLVFSPQKSNELVYYHATTATITILDVATGKTLQRLQTRGNYNIAISRNLIICSGDDSGPFIWNTTAEEEIDARQLEEIISQTDRLSPMAISPVDTSTAVWSHLEHCIKLQNFETGNCIHRFSHFKDIECIKFSSDGKYLAAAGFSLKKYVDPKVIFIYDTATGDTIQKFRYYYCKDLIFSSDGKMFAYQGFASVAVWEIDSGRCLGGYNGSDVNSMDDIFSMSADELIWATGKTIKVLKIDKLDPLSLDQDTPSKCNSFLLSSNGKSASAALPRYSHLPEGSTPVWDILSNRCKHIIKWGRETRDVIFSPDCKLLGIVSLLDRPLHLKYAMDLSVWDITSSTPRRTFVYTGAIKKFEFSPDSQKFVIIYGEVYNSSDYVIWIWDIASRTTLLKLGRDTVYGNPPSFCFSQDSKQFACSWKFATPAERSKKKIAFQVWDLSSGKCTDGITVNDWNQHEFQDRQSDEIRSSLKSESFTFHSPGHYFFESNDDRLRLLLTTDKSGTPFTHPMDLVPRVKEKDMYGISRDNCWITRRGENIIWLPLEYRPYPSGAWDVHENIVAIYVGSQRLCVVQFCCAACSTRIRVSNEKTTSCSASHSDKYTYAVPREGGELDFSHSHMESRSGGTVESDFNFNIPDEHFWFRGQSRMKAFRYALWKRINTR